MFTVSDETSLGMPALIWACRLGIWPCPACNTCSEDQVLDLFRRHLGALERGRDRGAAELRGVEASRGRRRACRTACGRRRESRSLARCASPSRLAGVVNDTGGIDCRRRDAPDPRLARSGAPEETAADTRVVGLFEGESLADPRLQALVELGEAKPGLRKVAVAHEEARGEGSAGC